AAAKPTAPASAAPTTTASASIPGANPWSAIPGMPHLQAIFYKATDSTALDDRNIVNAVDEIGGPYVDEVKKNCVRMLLGADVHEVTIKYLSQPGKNGFDKTRRRCMRVGGR